MKFKYRVFTTLDDHGEEFSSLVDALKYTFQSIDQLPFREFLAGYDEEESKWGVYDFLFKIMDLETNEIIWEESNE